jgi:hypothetical protein
MSHHLDCSKLFGALAIGLLVACLPGLVSQAMAEEKNPNIITDGNVQR